MGVLQKLFSFFPLKKGKVFYRYLISYFMLLFGVVLMGMLLYFHCYELYRQQVEANVESRLEQLGIILDAEMVKISETAQQIFSNPDFTPFNLAQQPVEGMYLQRELKKYALYNLLIDDVYFYPGSGEYLISAATSTSKELFYTQYTFDGGKDALETTQSPAVLSGQHRYGAIVDDLLLVVYSDTRYEQKTMRTLIFTLNKDSIWKLVNTNRHEDAISVCIYDEDGLPLMSVFSDEQSREVLRAVQTEPSGTVQIENQEYFCQQRRSDAVGWTYLMMVDSDSALQPVYQIRSLMLAGLGVVIILGIVVSFFWTLRKFRPLAELQDMAQEVSTGNTQETQDLYDNIKYAFDMLQFKNVALRNEVQSSTAAVREHLLYSLLRGQITSREMLKEKGANIGVELPWENYAVAIFRTTAGFEEAQGNLALLRQEIQQALPQGIIGYVREHNTPGNLVMLMCLQEGKADVSDALAACRALLAEKTGVSVSVGIGETYNNLADYPRSYIEALDALDYRFLKGENSVLVSSQLKRLQKHIPPEVRSASEKLEQLLREEDLFAIKAYFVEMANMLRNSGVTVSVAKMVCYDIANTVYRYLERRYHSAQSTMVESPNVFIISSFDTIDDLLRILLRVSNGLIDQFERENGGEELPLHEKMVEYIKEHCSNCDFSVGQMADAFSMSPSNLSQYFKSRQGETVMEFVTQMKFNKAKELLLNTQMPLQDIAIEVGYYNVTSFIRRFKQQSGQTPNDYRKNHS